MSAIPPEKLSSCQKELDEPDAADEDKRAHRSHEERVCRVDVSSFGTDYGERLNQLDLRIGKLLRFGGTRTSLNVDMFNVFNGSAVTTENPSFPAAFRRPTQIMLARFVKLSAQFDF